ncbi:kappa-casein isoform X2 [Mastomys coucha]|uniref:kappa-casein isoform X2 n=1 Tax=Mastomys coucha TaxID=35658 RepID=UPI00126244A1|nr:kappa-casein isoform X2 [Mastomys coucha]
MMRNFIIVVNILALTLPFLCHEKNEVVYNNQRGLYTPAHFLLNHNRYEPSYYRYMPPVPVSSYLYYPFLVKIPLLRSPAQISKWQPMPNFPQSASHSFPNPSFLAIPINKDQDSTAIPTINPSAPIVSTPVPTTESVVGTAANPEASTVSINTPETATVPVSSAAA